MTCKFSRSGVSGINIRSGLPPLSGAAVHLWFLKIQAAVGRNPQLQRNWTLTNKYKMSYSMDTVSSHAAFISVEMCEILKPNGILQVNWLEFQQSLQYLGIYHHEIIAYKFHCAI